MSNKKRAVVALIVGGVFLAVCAAVAAVPTLREAALERLLHVGGMVIGFSAMSVGLAVTTLAKDQSVPVWLRLLGCASLIPAWAVLLLVFALMGGWILLATPVFVVIAWSAGGRPTWKEFNTGYK